ncbi:MAG TPA: hypothetical protein VFL80_09025 [Thermoanaerobaculia bacterium]|nr:hypothetical protein [Thermoanaerobaculia bacterium]
MYSSRGGKAREGEAQPPGVPAGSTGIFEAVISVERGFVVFVTASALFMALVLLLDGDGLPRQAALGVATAGFVWLFGRRLTVAPRQIIAAMVVGSLGEVVLSLGWGLYSYQHALIPLYVPPGHGLFYLLAAATATQKGMQKHATRITRTVLISGTLMALGSVVFFNDVWGLLWWCGALLLIGRSQNQLLLSACFVYTLLLEWTGTAIGNWRWAAEVPFLGLPSANPPAGVGILYVLLDLVVVAITGLTVTVGRREPAQEPVPASVGHAGTSLDEFNDATTVTPPLSSSYSG